jgi:hypothetical protein
VHWQNFPVLPHVVADAFRQARHILLFKHG